MKSSRSSFWLVALAPLALAVCVLTAGVHGGVGEWRYAREGRVARAVVSKKHVRRWPIWSLEGYLSLSNYERRIGYRFPTERGEVVEGDAPLARERWAMLVVGDPGDIRYLPDRPTDNRVEGQTRWLVHGAMLGIGGALLWVSWSLGWFTVRWELERWRLSRGAVLPAGDGARSQGTITDVTETREREGNETLWLVRYAFHDRRGMPQQGEMKIPERELRQLGWRVGSTGRVVFDPEAPGRSVLTPWLVE